MCLMGWSAPCPVSSDLCLPLDPRRADRQRLTSIRQLPEEIQREIILATLEPVTNQPTIDERRAIFYEPRASARPAARLPRLVGERTPLYFPCTTCGFSHSSCVTPPPGPQVIVGPLLYRQFVIQPSPKQIASFRNSIIACRPDLLASTSRFCIDPWPSRELQEHSTTSVSTCMTHSISSGASPSFESSRYTGRRLSPQEKPSRVAAGQPSCSSLGLVRRREEVLNPTFVRPSTPDSTSPSSLASTSMPIRTRLGLLTWRFLFSGARRSTCLQPDRFQSRACRDNSRGCRSQSPTAAPLQPRLRRLRSGIAP